MKRTAGFSLLEALIALAIASLALTILFGVQRELVQGQQHYGAATERSELRQDALAAVRDVNPNETPEGEIALSDGATVRWTSEALNDPTTTRRLPTGNGTFTVALYRLSVEVVDDTGTTVDTFEVERMGWSSTQVAN